MRWWWCRQGPTPVLGICVALFCLCFIVLFLGGGGGHGGKHQLGAGYLHFLLFFAFLWARVGSGGHGGGEQTVHWQVLGA